MNVSEDKQAELEALKIWCDELVNYVMEREPSASFLNSFKVAVSKSFEKDDLKSLKKLKGELEEWLSELSKDDREELEHMLYEKSGIAAVGQNNEVGRLLLIGEISSDDEFRMLSNYIDELLESDNQNKATTIDAINILMRKYEQLKKIS